MGQVDSISSFETGALGIFHLKRLWCGILGLLDGNVPEKTPNENNLNRVLYDGLGLGRVDVDQFLFNRRPTFEEFESWILSAHGGSIPRETIDKINRRVKYVIEEPAKDYPLATVIEEPVFSKEEMEFWDKNGYVILHQAISPEHAKATEMAVWEFAGKDPENTETWYQGDLNFWVPMYQHATFQKTRASKRIHKAFAQLWGTEDLVCEINRASMNFPSDTHGTYLSGPSNLHWDISLALPLTFDVLGMIYLTDTEENQGAFQCIPGFHHHAEDWLQSLPADVNPRDEILKDADLAITVPGRAGDLLICRQELAHGSTQNNGTYPRVCQYISMYPPDYGSHSVWK